MQQLYLSYNYYHTVNHSVKLQFKKQHFGSDLVQNPRQIEKRCVFRSHLRSLRVNLKGARTKIQL